MKLAGAFDGKGTKSSDFVTFSQSSTRRVFRWSGIVMRIEGRRWNVSSCWLKIRVSECFNGSSWVELVKSRKTGSRKISMIWVKVLQ